MDAQCRACSTAERTATNIIQAPIARAHRAPHAPRSSRLCSLLLLPLLPACAARSRAACSSLTLPALSAPAPCSLLLLLMLLLLLPALHSCLRCSQLPFRLWRCSRTFLSTTCVCYSIFRLCFSALSLAPWTLPFLI